MPNGCLRGPQVPRRDELRAMPQNANATTGALDAATRTIDEAVRSAIDSGVIDLPAMPDVCLKLLELCEDEDADAQSMSALLLTDPVLAGHLLRIANSAHFGGKETIVSLQQAISRLGLQQVAEVALTISLRGALLDPSRRPELVRSLWRHSTTTAVTARAIARHMRRNAENVYLAGLLASTGRIVVMGCAHIHEKAMGVEISDSALLDIMARHHVDAGTALVESWRLPQIVAESICADGRPNESSPPEVCIASFASQLAAFGLDDLWSVTLKEVQSLDLLEWIDLYPDDVDTLLERVPEFISMAEQLS